MESSTWYDFCVHIFFTHKFNLTNWLFCSYTQESLLFSKVVFDGRGWVVLQARGHTGASTTRGVSHPASPGFANSVLHHFCHPTLFVAQMVRNQAARKHVLKARGQSAFRSSNSHVSPLVQLHGT